MRKLIVCNLLSLDGLYAGPGGQLGGMPFDRGFSEYNAERLRAADTLLLGRRTFGAFRDYWPRIAADASQPPLERELAGLNTAMQKVVISNGLKPSELVGWGPVRVVPREGAHAEVAALRAEPGRDVLVFGSHVLWNDLLANGLVDELHLLLGAGVVLEGVRAFEARPAAPLRLLEARRFDESSLVLLRYAVGR